MLARDMKGLQQPTLLVTVGCRQLAPGSVRVFERDLRVEPRRALVATPAFEPAPVVKHARLEDAEVLDALEAPIEVEGAGDHRQRMAQKAEVLPLTNLLREKAYSVPAARDPVLRLLGCSPPVRVAGSLRSSRAGKGGGDPRSPACAVCAQA